jgi:hypothetical protein
LFNQTNSYINIWFFGKYLSHINERSYCIF